MDYSNIDPAFADVFGSGILGGRRPNNPWEGVPGRMGTSGDMTPQQLAANQATQQQTQQQQSDAMFKKIQDLVGGRANEIRNDPVQTGVMNYLQGVMGGQNVPYTDTVLNSLQAQNGRGTATAEGAQMQQLREALGASGGSIYDPSYQAASREQESQRQGRNLDYAGQLNAQAGLANQQAQQNASAQLGALRSNQNSQITGLDQALAGYQAGRFQDVQNTTPQTLMPQYSVMGGAGGHGSGGQAQPSAPQSTTPSWQTANMNQDVLHGQAKAQTVPSSQPAAAAPPSAETLNPGYSQGADGAWNVKPGQQSSWTTNNFDIASLLKGLVGMGG